MDNIYFTDDDPAPQKDHAHGHSQVPPADTPTPHAQDHAYGPLLFTLTLLMANLHTIDFAWPIYR